MSYNHKYQYIVFQFTTLLSFALFLLIVWLSLFTVYFYYYLLLTLKLTNTQPHLQLTIILSVTKIFKYELFCFLNNSQIFLRIVSMAVTSNIQENLRVFWLLLLKIQQVYSSNYRCWSNTSGEKFIWYIEEVTKCYQDSISKVAYTRGS